MLLWGKTHTSDPSVLVTVVQSNCLGHPKVISSNSEEKECGPVGHDVLMVLEDVCGLLVSVSVCFFCIRWLLKHIG